MTMPPVQGWTPEETFNYAMGKLNALDEGIAKRVVIEVGKRLAEQYRLGLESVEKASGMRREKDPVKRLQWYRMKPQVLWEEQMMKFPRRWERDWKDYQDLRQRALEGDFGMGEQMAEAMKIAEESLTVTE